MKKSYIKLYIFQIFIILILFLSSFKSNILGGYKSSFFLLLCNLILYKILGFEKDKSRYKKDMVLLIIKDMFIYFIFIYLMGILIGFAKSGVYYYNINSIINIIIPLIINIVLKEVLRYGILTKSSNKKDLVILCTFIFILFDIVKVINITQFDSARSVFMFIALTLLPSISVNIFLTYLCKKSGLIPCIIYLLFVRMYLYIMPIIPNMNEYLKSINDLILPVIFFLITYRQFKKVNDDYLERDYKKFKFNSLLLPLALTIVFVYFISGYFKYYAIAIVSNSMVPVFSRGDVVIVNQRDKNYEVGEVVAFKVENKVIVHRIVKIIDVNGEKFIYTKGDANENIDDSVTKYSDIVGVVNWEIPIIGYPTVLFSEL